MLSHPYSARHDGVTLIEVLVTVVILGFGLLGLAGLQSKFNIGLIEAYQRAQAIVLLDSMSERMKANRAHAADYVTSGTLGTGDTQPADCMTVAAGAARDLCEWSAALKGAAEATGSTNTGAMIGARGCITQLQAENAASGVCSPGIYQITVAWQGMHATQAPAATCGANLYGADANRRAISTQVSVGLSTCH